MNIISKLEEIKRLQEANSDEHVGVFNRPITESEILRIENLIQEPLPFDFKQLYLYANGQSNEEKGILLGEFPKLFRRPLRDLDIAKMSISKLSFF